MEYRYRLADTPGKWSQWFDNWAYAWITKAMDKNGMIVSVVVTYDDGSQVEQQRNKEKP